MTTGGADRARHLAAIGRYADAERHLRPALAEAPTDAGMLTLLGYLLRRQGRCRDALAACEAAATAAPDSADAHVQRAEVLMSMHRFDQAIDAATVAAQLDPQDARGHLIVARALEFQDRTEPARAAALYALALRPGSVPALLTLAEIERGAGNRTAAEAALDEALHSDPNHPRGRWLRAMLDADGLQVARSVRTLRGVARDQPADLDLVSLTWPLRRAAPGPWWWLTGAAALLAFAGLVAHVLGAPTSVTVLTRLVAGLSAGFVAVFWARVLIPAGRTPWRCLALCPRLARNALLAGLGATAAAAALLGTYTLTGWWPLPVLAVVLTPVRGTCSVLEAIGFHRGDEGFQVWWSDIRVRFHELGQEFKDWARDTRRELGESDAERSARHARGQQG